MLKNNSDSDTTDERKCADLLFFRQSSFAATDTSALDLSKFLRVTTRQCFVHLLTYHPLQRI